MEGMQLMQKDVEVRDVRNEMSNMTAVTPQVGPQASKQEKTTGVEPEDGSHGLFLI